MSTCEHKGPGPCPICEHVELASIPSSPEVEEQRRIERDLCLRIITRDPSAEHVQEGTALLIAYRESVHAASTQPLLAEVESVEKVVRKICPTDNTETEDDPKYVCIGESGDPIIEAETLAEAVESIIECWGDLQEQLEKRIAKLEADNRGFRENNIETNKLRIAAEAEAQKLREALKKVLPFATELLEEAQRLDESWDDAEAAFDEARKALGGSK